MRGNESRSCRLPNEGIGWLVAMDVSAGTRPLRLLMVVHAFPPESWAGTEIYTLDIARALQQRGHEVTVLHAITDPTKKEYSLEEGTFEQLRVLRLVNQRQYRLYSETFRNPRVEEIFRSLLKRERPDVVHFQHAVHLSAFLLGITADAGIPTLVTLHDYWFFCPSGQLIRPNKRICQGDMGVGCAQCAIDRHPVVRLAGRTAAALGPVLAPVLKGLHAFNERVDALPKGWLFDVSALAARTSTLLSQLDRAHLIIAPSRFLWQQYLEHGVDPTRLIFSRHGLRTESLQGLDKRSRQQGEGPRFTYIGSLIWSKGLETLIEAFNQLPERASSLRIYGATDRPATTRAYYQQLRRRVCRSGISFEGEVTHDQLPDLYRGFDVLIVPSLWYENSPMTIQEAFAAKTPVITSDIGGMTELVDDGINGFVFRVGDPDDLATKMRRFIEQPELIEQLGARTPVVKTAAEQAAELESHYRRLLFR